jgi:hypothetical protein
MRQLKLWLALITGLALGLQLKAQDDPTPTQTICEGETRPYRVDKDENGGAGTTGSTYAWSVTTAGFTGTITPNQGPSGSSNRILINWGSTPPGFYTLQVIETNDGCAADPVQMTIEITPKVDPTFNLGPYCQGSTPPSLPLTSTNGITGTWSPSAINTSSAGSSNYTFTPDPGQCANPAVVSITISPLITPTFNPVAAICSGETLTALPTTSTNGITGTWSPALNNTATTLYTFTPNGSQCASSATLTITVNDPVTPTFTAVGPFCSGATIPALPTTSNNGISGTWSPAISNTATTTYTFTPDAGECATSTTLQIVITPLPTITLIGSPACSGDLLTYSVAFSVSSGTPSNSEGTLDNTGGNNWEITGITAGTPVTISLDVAGCVRTLDITAPDCNCPAVDAPTNPVSTSYCAGASVTSVSATVPAGFTVDWYDAASGGTRLQEGTASGVNTYTPSGPGTFYAVARDLTTGCLSSTRTPATVTQNALPTVTASADVSICTGETTQLSASGASTYTWSPATGLSTTTGTPVDANPTSDQTYTVTGTDSNGCQNTDTVTVTVKPKPVTSPIFHD